MACGAVQTVFITKHTHTQEWKNAKKMRGTETVERKERWPSENCDFAFHCCRAPCIHSIKLKCTNIFNLLLDVCWLVHAPNATHLCQVKLATYLHNSFSFSYGLSFISQPTRSRGATARFSNVSVCVFVHLLLVFRFQPTIQYSTPDSILKNVFQQKLRKKHAHTKRRKVWHGRPQFADRSHRVLVSCTMYTPIFFAFSNSRINIILSEILVSFIFLFWKILFNDPPSPSLSPFYTSTSME